MVTKVGTQSNIIDALIDVIELDYDAREAYDAAINRLDNKAFRDELTKFRNDHDRHIQDLSAYLKKHGYDAPTGGSAKQILTQGKVVIANLMGDKYILSAMRDNELDTNKAYERLVKYEGLEDELSKILNRNLEDEKRHKKWLEDTLRSI